LDSTQNELACHYLRKARDKVRVAAALLRDGEWEDAVSRAYYAAFHAAQAVLLTEGQHPHSHQGLLTLFSLLLVKTGKFEKKWGRLLANLKDDREAGDYEVFAWLDEETARRAVREAEEFVSEVQRYLGAAGIKVI
jgi:uncharacterized protein (UPF0332 family)